MHNEPVRPTTPNAPSSPSPAHSGVISSGGGAGGPTETTSFTKEEQRRYESLKSAAAGLAAHSTSHPPSSPGSHSKYSSLSAHSNYLDIMGASVDVERGRDYNPEFERDSKKYMGKGTVRYFFGYDVSKSNYLGTERLVEKHRAESLNRVIESPDAYDSELYSSFYINSLKKNNQVYKLIYQYFFVFLSLTFGVLISVSLGLLTAVVEFTIQFAVRPLLKMIKMASEIFVLMMQMAVDVIRPCASLLFPWNKN